MRFRGLCILVYLVFRDHIFTYIVMTMTRNLWILELDSQGPPVMSPCVTPFHGCLNWQITTRYMNDYDFLKDT